MFPTLLFIDLREILFWLLNNLNCLIVVSHNHLILLMSQKTTMEPLYSGHALQQTPPLQRTLFLRMGGVMVTVLQKNIFIADRNIGHFSIADTIVQNQWQFSIEIYLFIVDSYYSSMFIKRLQCFCTKKNLETTLYGNQLDSKCQFKLW